MEHEEKNAAAAVRDHQYRPSALIVGFTQPNATDIGGLLATVNWSMIPAEDGDGAIRMAEVRTFDFILVDAENVDIFAPVLVEAVRIPSSASRSATIVAFGAYFHPSFRERLINCGFDGFCALPIDTATLVSSLTEASVKRLRSASATRAVSAVKHF